MKRKKNLYESICNMQNILKVYQEVCRNTKNKRKVRNYREYKCLYVAQIYKTLSNKNYEVGPYHVFTIYEPKERRIVSQSLQDKVINHLVARYILYPAILPGLIPENVASIKNRGTKKGLELFQSYQRKCKIKYQTYYILKCDISKYFASIDQTILKQKIRRKIKDKDALQIIDKIIDSEENGLGIGNMTSQVFAIFYLNDLDHYIKEELHISYYVRYQDDFLLFHPSKQYLKECLEKITQFLKHEKLTLNKKTRIFKNTNNFIFLGRDKKGKYAKYRNVRRKLRKKMYLYEQEKIPIMNLLNSVMSYEKLCNRRIQIKK